MLEAFEQIALGPLLPMRERFEHAVTVEQPRNLVKALLQLDSGCTVVIDGLPVHDDNGGMSSWRPSDSAVTHLYRQSRADRWSLPVAVFAAALERSARKVFVTPPSRAISSDSSVRYISRMSHSPARAQRRRRGLGALRSEHRPGSIGRRMRSIPRAGHESLPTRLVRRAVWPCRAQW